ncbi:ACRO protein, partial [Piprites chloris]|nr:ACRO protein [Piprites chloris]
QVRRIKQVYLHELYDGYILYDIALVELDKPIVCTPSVQLACLPTPTVAVSPVHCYVAGWGDTYAKRIPLKQSGALLIDTQVCNSSDWYGGKIQDYNLCAGYPEGGRSTCQVRSVLQVIQPRHWAYGCARAKNPSVFVSTQYFYNWIMEKMG